MNLTIENSLDEQVWREFVDNHPQGNIFHTPEMFRVYERAKGHRPGFWAAVDDCGEPLALFTPVLVTLKDGPLRRLTTRSISYGSVLCAPDVAGEKALKFLLQMYNRKAGKDALFTELRNLSDLSAIQTLLEVCGFAYEDHLNYLIDLDCSPEQLLQNMGSRTRKHIRRELRKGQIVVEEVNCANQVATVYELIKKSYTTAKVPVADISLFKAAYEILYPRNMVKFWLARCDDVPIAVSVELVYKDGIIGWYSGVDRAFSSHTPTELLMWHILRWGAENGYRVYDFGGAGTPDEEYGVRDFKAKFGGRLVCFGRNTFVHSPGLLRLSTAGYGIYRKFLHH